MWYVRTMGYCWAIQWVKDIHTMTQMVLENTHLSRCLQGPYTLRPWPSCLSIWLLLPPGRAWKVQVWVCPRASVPLLCAQNTFCLHSLLIALSLCCNVSSHWRSSFSLSLTPLYYFFFHSTSSLLDTIFCHYILYSLYSDYIMSFGFNKYFFAHLPVSILDSRLYESRHFVCLVHC